METNMNREQKHFTDAKEALSFLGQKRAEGYSAKIVHHGGQTTGKAPSQTVWFSK